VRAEALSKRRGCIAGGHIELGAPQATNNKGQGSPTWCMQHARPRTRTCCSAYAPSASIRADSFPASPPGGSRKVASIWTSQLAPLSHLLMSTLAPEFEFQGLGLRTAKEARGRVQA
jgi:hypothetical protein